MPETKLTEADIIHAVKNDHDEATFTLGDRAFPYRDLEYDDYLDFIRLVKPILEAAAGGLEVKPTEEGKVGVGFDPSSVDFDLLLGAAGKELPHMAWLCCKQSDPKITVGQVKKLARRPQVLIQAVLGQVKHNDLIREFADFFPQIGQALLALAPDFKALMTPTQLPTESTTEEIPS